MKRALLSLLLIAFIAMPVLAGQNPDIRIYLDVDPPMKVHEIHPTANATFDVYVCLDCFSADGGTRGTAFLLQRAFTGFVACIAVIQYLYLGGPGTLNLLPHGLEQPGTGREVLDCEFASDFYCIYANLGVSVPPEPGEDGCDCEPPQPVEDSTWGGIKSLYR
jgi:hypothetical protein